MKLLNLVKMSVDDNDGNNCAVEGINKWYLFYIHILLLIANQETILEIIQSLHSSPIITGVITQRSMS
jgi:hypothetical protein